jgi:hypothetical protein
MFDDRLHDDGLELTANCRKDKGSDDGAILSVN